MTDIMKLADDYAECMYLRREKHEARAALQSAIEALTVERDALQAKLDAIQKQEPRFWYDEDIGELYASANNHFVDRWTALYAAPKALEPLTDEQMRDAFAQALTDVYVCTRVWSAWSYGTMTEDDFSPASECDEVLDSLVQAAHGIGGTP